MNVTLVVITVEIENLYFIHVQEIKLIDMRDEQDAAFWPLSWFASRRENAGISSQCLLYLKAFLYADCPVKWGNIQQESKLQHFVEGN